MANYCSNKLNLIGPTQKIQEYVKSIKDGNVFFDFSEPEVETIDDNKLELSIFFNTRWEPPIGIYEELLIKGFDVEAGFFEPGEGFYGRFTDGTTIIYEYEGLTELDDEFVKYFELQDWIEDEIFLMEMEEEE
jgi:hypothetical protein